MRPTAGRALFGAALLIVAILLFVVLQDDGNDTSEAGSGADSPAPARQRPADRGDGGKAKRSQLSLAVVEIVDGMPAGGVRELEFGAGDRIRFEVESDVADEVHVHGYDVSKDVEAGGSVRFDFPATIEGVFEVELEDRAEPIAELRVSP